MRQIFEEYGKMIVAVIAAIAVLALLFGGNKFFGLLGSSLDVNTEVSYNQGENALGSVITREKPRGNFDGVNLHLYKNAAFRPLHGVKFSDVNGNTVNGVVTSILYYDSEGNKTELIDYYNSDEDVIILNPGHYSSSHLECNVSEFTASGGDFIIIDDASQNCPGVVIVTYAATDSENQVTVEQLTFVIDNKDK